jgi:Cys-rich protein (TIGR01571 family)
MAGKWINSAWDCCSPAGDCFMACCCPCIIHTHTAQRLDPMKGNNEAKHDTCNGDCFVYCVAASCGFGWVMSMMRRTEVRNKFGIEGSACGDCCMSFCCVCCVEMQNAKECKSRLPGGTDNGVNTQGYAPQTGMQVPGQQPMGYSPHQPYDPPQH